MNMTAFYSASSLFGFLGFAVIFALTMTAFEYDGVAAGLRWSAVAVMVAVGEATLIALAWGSLA